MASMCKKKMRVAVAGATGNVGQHVVRALLDGGHEVRALTRDHRKGEDILSSSYSVLFCLLLLLLLRLQVLPSLRWCCGFGLLLCAAFESYSTLEASSHQPNLALSLASFWSPERSLSNAPRCTRRHRIKSMHIPELRRHLVRVARVLFAVLVRLHLAACQFVSAPTATKLRLLPSQARESNASII